MSEPSPPEPRINLAVVGAHLEGQPLHHQLTDRDAQLVARTTTAANYRLFALDTEPPKPGLVHVVAADDAGAPATAAIAVEVWSLTEAAFGSFVAEVPPPLAIGTVELADGTSVSGFVCEPYALEGALEITRYGGWRSHLAARAEPR